MPQLRAFAVLFSSQGGLCGKIIQRIWSTQIRQIVLLQSPPKRLGTLDSDPVEAKPDSNLTGHLDEEVCRVSEHFY